MSKRVITYEKKSKFTIDFSTEGEAKEPLSEKSKLEYSNPEYGNDWNKHITYVIIDFLSGWDVFMSTR